MNWYLKVVRDNYANFKGRARRKEYWMFFLVNFIISFIISSIFTVVAMTSKLPALASVGYLYSLAILLPSLAVAVRRLHDVGKSGWWILIGIIPIIGTIWIIVLLATDSTPGENKWGPNPKGIGNLSDIEKIGNE